MTTRREILTDGLRWGGLLALGGVTAALGWRTLHGQCLRRDPCGTCPMFSGCGLPQALDAKTHGRSYGNDSDAAPNNRDHGRRS